MSWVEREQEADSAWQNLHAYFMA